MKKLYFLCWLLSSCTLTLTQHYIFPVASTQDGQQLILLYQKSLQEIELWISDTATHTAIQGLSSFLTPANVKMLPSGEGFSFIDQGYIKIKEFAKRSPRTLPIYEPISFFCQMDWFSDDQFYFVAQKGDYFQIFLGDTQAWIHQLTHEDCDALYPCHIDKTFFYIKKYAPKNRSQIIAFDMTTMDEKIIFEHYTSRICYLTMLTHSEGFFIELPEVVSDQTPELYEFSCYHFIKKDDVWNKEFLFKFFIPSSYLIGSSRLYESMEMFLPNYICKDYVFFVSHDLQTDQLLLHKLCITTKEEEVVFNERFRNYTNKTTLFAPYIINNNLYCGMIMPASDALRHQTHDPSEVFNLPIFSY
jgi:hypothetical protein